MRCVQGRWRRWAVRLARHAAGVMPDARGPWAEAMRRELDYVTNDAAAFRWALGCIVASYRARLTQRPWFNVAPSWRHVATSGVLMILVGLSFQEKASGTADPPQPAFETTTCDLPAAPPKREAKSAEDVTDHSALAPDPKDICRLSRSLNEKIETTFPDQGPDSR